MGTRGMNTADWQPIPVRRLRSMKRQLARMMADFESYYPNILQSEEYGTYWSNPQTETVRNAATALGEINGWIAARVQGLREDPCQ